MALQFRRGTQAELNTITPAPGEPIWTTDTNVLSIGDGVNPGGVAVNYSLNTATTSTLGGVKIGLGISITADGTISAAGGGLTSSTFYNATVTNALYIGTQTNAVINTTGAVDGGLYIANSTGKLTLGASDRISLDSNVAVQLGGASVLKTDFIESTSNIPITVNDTTLFNYASTFTQTAYFQSNAVVSNTLEAQTIRKAGYPGLINLEIQGNLTPATSGQSDLGASPSGANKQFGYVYANTGTFSAVEFTDSTRQTTAAVNGQTSVYARNALPAGTTGTIITVSDSGGDTNSPAGNWAPAYWDPDASVWTYIGNSNSVTPI